MNFENKLLFDFKLMFVLLLIFSFIGCDTSNEPSDSNKLKIGMLAENFGDSSYNENCKQGILDAQYKYDFIAEFKDGTSDAIVRANAQYFIDKKYDLLFYAGFLFESISTEFADKYPLRNFVMIDYDKESLPPSNMLGITFEVQQAAFPLGYLAAYWADSKSPINPKTATICGFDSKTLQKFYVAFDKGVKYYNSKHGKNVENQTVFSNTFRDLNVGRNLANHLIDSGVSVIFTVAGECGVGALEVLKQRGKWGIGVDDDQYLTLPTVRDILLSSCIKNTRNPVYEVTENFVKGNFKGGTIFKANMSNWGVAMAPYHDYTDEIPDNIKSEIANINYQIDKGIIIP